jgi:hypothetical protein
MDNVQELGNFTYKCTIALICSIGRLITGCFTIRPLNSRKRTPSTYWTGGCLSPKPGLVPVGKRRNHIST